MPHPAHGEEDVRTRLQHRRGRSLVVGLGVLVLVFSLVASQRSQWKLGTGRVSAPENRKSHMITIPEEPHPTLKDWLPAGERFITSFAVGGLHNQFIELWNLIYLGLVLDRIPIVDSLDPSAHILRTDPDEGRGSWTDYVDLTSLIEATGSSVVFWRDVKARGIRHTDRRESLHCWGRDSANNGAIVKNAQHEFQLDITHYPLPPSTPSNFSPFRSFTQVLALSQDTSHLARMDDKCTHGEAVIGEKPACPAPMDEDTVLCLSDTYYMVPTVYKKGRLFRGDDLLFPSQTGTMVGNPSWDLVGRHVHFSTRVNTLVRELLYNSGKLGSNVPYIAVHIRRGDFIRPGGAASQFSFDNYIAAVEKVQENLIRTQPRCMKGSRALKVFVATDESSPEYKALLTAHGWHVLDHVLAETVSKHGAWYPAFVDSAILGGACGLVGTSGSTMSRIAMTRVEEWQGGYSIMALK